MIKQTLFGLVAVLVAGFATDNADAKTFRWSFQTDILSIDPHSVNEPFTLGLLGNVMEPLIRYDADDRLEGALASSWELVEPMRWRFELRQNVSFHDGSPFTAEDVVFSLHRAKAEGSDFASALAPIAEIVAVDEDTVDIVLKHPYPILPNTLASLFVMDKQWAESNQMARPLDIKEGDIDLGSITIVGTGPFKFQSYQPGVEARLVPNEDWWDEARHNLTEVVFAPISADATRVAALLSGEIDLIYPVPLQNIEKINGTAGFQVLERPSERTIFIGLDQAKDELPGSNVEGKNPFKDVRVREAVYRAIDEDAIIEKIMRGHATAAGLVHAPSLQGFVPELNDRLAYDPAKAKELLTAAGYADGFGVGMNCPNDRYINDEQICQAIVGMLARVGIEVTLQAETRSKFFERVQNREPSMYLLGWGAATTRDAHNVLSYVFHTDDGKQGTWNGAGYSNVRVDELTDQIAYENDPGKRQELISEAFRIAKEEVAYIPLHQQHVTWGVRDGIRLVQRPNDRMPLRFVVIED